MKKSITFVITLLAMMLIVMPCFAASPDGIDPAVMETGGEADGSKDPGGFVVTGPGGNLGYLGDSSYGAYGENTGGNYGHLGSTDYGAYGYAGNENRAAVYGKNLNNSYGYLGTGSTGVRGYCSINGHYGTVGSEDYGIYGYSGDSFDYAVYGESVDGTYAYFCDANFAINGHNDNGSWGGLGCYDSGAKGRHPDSGNEGRLGTASYAGYFSGNVNITGNLSKGGGSFKIDHPLDPENKYLYHSFVESPDMMNVYNGNVILDEMGEASIELPEWFEVLNRDFRYQLTCIGGFAPVYIAQKISGNQFSIAGGEPGMEVSWQVTGIRQDPYAEANRIPVEEDKSPEEIGRFQHPELYGQPRDMGVYYIEKPLDPSDPAPAE